MLILFYCINVYGIMINNFLWGNILFMARTTSIAFPNMFNVTQNKVAVKEDEASIVNRVRLLILSDPTSLYNSPEFGVGLRKYLWQYNTEAMIQDNIRDQLRVYEPCVNPDQTIFVDGLLFTKSEVEEITAIQFNKIEMTVGLSTIYGDRLEIKLNSEE